MADKCRVKATEIELWLQLLSDAQLDEAWDLYEASKAAEGRELALVKGGKS